VAQIISRLNPYTDRRFWLFAKTGFTAGLIREAAQRDDVSLIRFEDML
jgi:hypothetical protein